MTEQELTYGAEYALNSIGTQGILWLIENRRATWPEEFVYGEVPTRVSDQYEKEAILDAIRDVAEERLEENETTASREERYGRELMRLIREYRHIGYR